MKTPPIVVFAAVVLVLTSSLIGIGESQKARQTDIEIPSNLSGGYAERIDEIMGRAESGEITWNQASAQIQEVLGVASRHEIPPWGWQSPPTTVIEQGSGVEAASYIIFPDGSGNYYAKSGDNGEVMFSGTNAATVINNALDALTSGRTWKEKIVLKRNFTISAKISVPSYTILDLYAAKLTLSNGVNDHMFEIDNKQDIEILGGYLDANGANQTGGYGISIKGISANILVKDSKITEAYLHGIRVENGSHDLIFEGLELSDDLSVGLYVSGSISPNYNIWVNDVYSHNNQQSGIYFADSNHFWITNSLSENNENGTAGDGIDILRSSEFHIVNSTCSGNVFGIGIYGNSTHGEVIGAILNNNKEHGLCIQSWGTPTTYPSNITVSGVIAYLNGTDNVLDNTHSTGICITNGNDMRISNSLSYNNGFHNSYPPSTAGIEIDGAVAGYGRRIQIIGNEVYDNRGTAYQRYGIRLVNNADYITIIGNDVRGNVDGQMILVGSNNVVSHNRGYTTENSGTATIAAGNTSIVEAHGLVTTPTVVSITPTENIDTRSYWWTADTTNITINMSDNHASNRTFSWYAENQG